MKYFITSGLPDLPAGLPDKEYNLVAPLYRGINNVAQRASLQTNAVQYSSAELSQLNPVAVLTQDRSNIIIVKAGEALAFGSLIYLTEVAGKLVAFKSDSTSGTGHKAVGCISSPGGLVTDAYGEAVFMQGLCTGITGATLGTTYYLGPAGAAAAAPGGIAQIVGIGMGSYGFYLNIEL